MSLPSPLRADRAKRKRRARPPELEIPPTPKGYRPKREETERQQVIVQRSPLCQTPSAAEADHAERFPTTPEVILTHINKAVKSRTAERALFERELRKTKRAGRRSVCFCVRRPDGSPAGVRVRQAGVDNCANGDGYETPMSLYGTPMGGEDAPPQTPRLTAAAAATARQATGRRSSRRVRFHPQSKSRECARDSEGDATLSSVRGPESPRRDVVLCQLWNGA